MNGMIFLEDLIARGKTVTVRLLEGRDIQAVPIAQDADSLIVKRESNGEYALIYKRAVSMITP